MHWASLVNQRRPNTDRVQLARKCRKFGRKRLRDSFQLSRRALLEFLSHGAGIWHLRIFLPREREPDVRDILMSVDLRMPQPRDEGESSVEFPDIR